MPETQSLATPPTTPVVQATPQQAEVKEPDLIQKVAAFKPPVSAPEQPELAAITDPAAKEAAKSAVERMRRDMQADYTRKTQELSASRKEGEKWTPERIQELLNNPQFVQSAQQVASTRPEAYPEASQYSALSDSEKSEMSALKNKLTFLEQSNFQANIQQQDTQLQNKYSDYNPIIVDEGIAKLSQLRPHEIREHVYKSLNHEAHVKAAYELGKADGQELRKNKINSLSADGSETNGAEPLPTREKTDTDQSWFVKLAQRNMERLKK